MTDKKIRQELAIIHGKLYSIMQAIALLTAATIKKDDDPGLMSRYADASKRMEEIANTYSTMLLNDIEAQDLADGSV